MLTVIRIFKDNFKKQKKGVDICKVIDYLRGKSIPVRQSSDTSATFKLNDENLFVDVSNGKFHLVKSFGLDEEVSLNLLMLANNDIMDDLYCIKAFIRKHLEIDQKGKPIEGTVASQEFVFSCECLCDSYSDFVNQYEWAIWALLDGINHHREIYSSYLEKAQQQRELYPQIGFNTNGVDIQNETVSALGTRKKIGFKS